MTARRLHAVCPRCQHAQAVRPDNTFVRHFRSSWGETYRCDGSHAPVPPGGVAEWLALYEADAVTRVRHLEETIDRAQTAIAEARAALPAATAEREERAAWCARARGRVQSGDARVSDGCVTGGGCDVG